MKEALLIIVGWLLAQMTGPIQTAIARRRRLPVLKRHLWTELDELRYRMTNVAGYARYQLGTVDKEFVLWVIGQLEDYSGREDKGLASWRSMSKSTPAEIDAISRALASKLFATTEFPKYRLPFLQSKLEDVAHFDIECQQELLEILRLLEVYNQTGDAIRTHHMRTFDSSLSNIDRETLPQNIRIGQEVQARESQNIANSVSRLKKHLTS